MNLGLAAVLRGDGRLEVVAADLEGAALEIAVAQHAPHVAILDEAAEHSVLTSLRSTRSETGVLVLAQNPTLEYGQRLLTHGVTCLARDAPTIHILTTVHLVASGECLFSSTTGQRIARAYPSDAAPLAPREIEVFKLLSLGTPNAQIARDMGIGIRTVETYTARILRKLQLDSKRDLFGMSHPTEVTRIG